MSLNIKLKHSAVANKKPQVADLQPGELALNINNASPAGYALDDAGAVQQMFGAASTTQAGQAELATQAEVDAGTDTERIVTPATLGQRLTDQTTAADAKYMQTAGGTMTGSITFASGANVTFDAGASPTFNGSAYINKPFYYNLDVADLSTGPSQIATGQYKQDAAVYLGTGAARIQQDNAANLTLSKNFANNSTGSKVFVNFMRKGLDYGTITAKISSTAFPDSRVIYQGDLSGTATPTSDYRLKDDVTLLEDGTAIIKKLRPVTFKWNYDPDSSEIGFIAHEVAEVIPSVVRGKKDEVKEDGSPEYQGVNYAGVVPALTKALQEALARIEALEAKV